MFKGILQALLGYTFTTKESQNEKKMFTEFLLKYDVVKAMNECDEERIIAFEKEPDHELNILVTKCKRLLSFVESRGLENKFATTLIDFGNEIEFCVQNKCDLEPMFEKYEKIKKVIKGNYMSSSHLSGNYINENIHLS
jgi:hypothetical protein